jgi:hypothetical protein
MKKIGKGVVVRQKEFERIKALNFLNFSRKD